MQMRDGYIIKVKGMAIYSHQHGERITRVELILDHFCVQGPCIYQLCDIMSQRWWGRCNQGQRGRVAGGYLPQAGSLGNNTPVEEGPTPLSFNSGAQYMAETPARVESIIAVKELELIQ